MAMENNQGPYFVFLSLERMTSSKGFLKQPIMFLHRSVLRLFYLQCVKYICSVLVHSDLFHPWQIKYFFYSGLLSD